MNNNIFLVDKPKDWTSFDVVAKIRSTIQAQTGIRKKVGHTGTLDPFATGLLIVLVGQETKKQHEYKMLDKEYEAIFRLGKTSSTDDLTGTLTLGNDKPPELASINLAINRLTGPIKQIPPKYSAKKIKGQRAYKLARQDIPFVLAPQEVVVTEFTVISYKYPNLTVRIGCSSGTYIRSLARDLGDIIGCGAYVQSLRRTRIGNYTITEAIPLKSLCQNQKSN